MDGSFGGDEEAPKLVSKELQLACSPKSMQGDEPLWLVAREVESDKDDIGSQFPLCTIPPKQNINLSSDWVLKKVKDVQKCGNFVCWV